jgi:hypothetical protein
MRGTSLEADPGPMYMHPLITEALAREHVADLQGRPGRAVAQPRRLRRRTAEVLGWWLIHLGQRLLAARGNPVRLAGEAAGA